MIKVSFKKVGAELIDIIVNVLLSLIIIAAGVFLVSYYELSPLMYIVVGILSCMFDVKIKAIDF